MDVLYLDIVATLSRMHVRSIQAALTVSKTMISGLESLDAG